MALADKTSTRTRTIIYIGIAIAAFIAYEPMRHNVFVNYDDPKYITQNPHIVTGITWDSLKWAFTKSYVANWHPLTWMSHIIDYQLFGFNPLGHHLVSLLLHIVNSLLIFWMFVRMTGATWPSAFVAAVFAMHPLQVESVAWASELKTVLSGLFWLLTMTTYVYYTKQPRIGRYILLLLVFGLCIMTKPIVVTLPPVLLLLDYWPLDRDIKWRLIIEKIPLLALSAILSVITFTSQRQEGAVATLGQISLDDRISNMFVSYMRYIGKMIWPSHLAVFYPPLPANFPKAVEAICALLFILIFGLSIYMGRHKKYITVGWLWYIGTIVPMIGLVRAGAQSMADRYMYIPMLGLLVIVAWIVNDLTANRQRLKIISAILASAVILSMISLTRTQVSHWKDSLTLFAYTINVTKDNAIAEDNYGCALFEAGRIDDALLHLRRAVKISPVFTDARANLGKALLKKGDLDGAVSCYAELIMRKQDSAEIYYNLALALSLQKKYDDAAKYFAKSLKMEPQYKDVHMKMGAVLLAAGKAAEAVPYLSHALQIEPNNVEIYANLGMAYIQLGKYTPALKNLTKAIELKPDSEDILNNLAWLLAAVDDASVRDVNKAVAFAQRACELTEYKNPVILDTLGVAYAAAGKFDDAIKTAQQAVNIAESQGRKDILNEIQSRLELYKTGRPYLQK